MLVGAGVFIEGGGGAAQHGAQFGGGGQHVDAGGGEAVATCAGRVRGLTLGPLKVPGFTFRGVGGVRGIDIFFLF